jgi:TPR repeat protein
LLRRGELAVWAHKLPTRLFRVREHAVYIVVQAGRLNGIDPETYPARSPKIAEGRLISRIVEAHAVGLATRIIGEAIAISVTLKIAGTEAAAADLKEVSALQTAIHQADRRGDFEGAVRDAEECVTITKDTAAGPEEASASPYYCVYYLGSALRKGRGVPRDEGRAFGLLKALAASDPDGDAALDLAEDYLDGAGTPRNSIEAAVIFWRVEHGAWSFYSDYWGMCTAGCESLYSHEKVVEERLARELSFAEKQQSELIAADRFPDIAARAKRRDGQVEATVAVVAALTGGLLWWRTRSRKRFVQSP